MNEMPSYTSKAHALQALRQSVTVHGVAQPRAKRLGWVVRSTTRSNIIIAATQEMTAFFLWLHVCFAHPIPTNGYAKAMLKRQEL